MKDEIKKIVEPVIESEGFILDSVELENRDGKKALVISIDKEDGSISVDECSRISKLIDPLIEKRDLFEESYLLIVSSPGS